MRGDYTSGILASLPEEGGSMTVAEKMTDVVIEYLDELHVMIFDEDMAELRGELKLLVQKVAERGRKEAAGTVSCPCHGCSGRKELILDNKWEEEEA